MSDDVLRAALQRHWDASDVNDFDAEHEIYRTTRFSSIRNRASASAVGPTFRHREPRSQTSSGSRYDACSVAATSGSLSW